MFASTCRNIILSGGNTKLNGFRQRLYNELLPFSSNNKIDIKQKKNIDTSIWLGGSVIASNDNFNNHIPTSCHVFWAQNSLKNDPQIPILKGRETTLLKERK